MPQFRNFSERVEISEHASGADAHRHQSAYAAIVLEGGYLETSADGPVYASAGDIIIHPPFHQHKNLFQHLHTRVLNVALPFCDAQAMGYRIRRGVHRSALKDMSGADPQAAALRIFECASTGDPSEPHDRCGLDQAAEALRDDPFLPITALAARTGYAHGYFTRLFAARYGGPPAAFRSEHRFRQALNKVLARCSLADAASSAGYADQAHMTRDFRGRTGKSPAALLREVKFIQDCAATA